MKKLLSIIISLTIMLAVGGPCYSATPLIDNAFKITDQQGRPVPGGKVFTYEPGTTTPKLTFSDEEGTIPHTNPVILDSSGKELIYGSGTYTIDVQSMFGSQIAGFPKIVDVTVTTSEVITISGEVVNSFNFDSIESLREFQNDGDVIYERATVSGYYAPGGGGGGPPRTWDEGKSIGFYTDNGGSIIVPIGGDGSAAWIFKIVDSVIAEEWGAIEDGFANDSPVIQDLVDFAAKKYVVKLLGPIYKFDTVVTLPAGTTITGVVSDGHNLNYTRINDLDAAGTFKTDETVNDFAGISISNFRINGGTLGNYSIKSHYPYTNIKNIHIENLSGRYLGNGIRIHNDGGQPGMGGWKSRILNSKVVLDNDSVNRRVGIRLEINGGDVVVRDCTTIFGEIGIHVISGENIIIEQNNTNQHQDFTSTGGNIQRAAIVVGNNLSLTPKNVVVQNNYIESHSRAVLVRSGSIDTTILNNYINDTQAYDTSLFDGEIELASGFDGCLVQGNNSVIGYNTKALVNATVAANKRGWQSISNNYEIDRGALPFSGNNFTGDAPTVRLGDFLKKTVSSVTTFIDYDQTFNNIEWGSISENSVIKNFSGSAAIGNVTTLLLFSGVSPGTYNVSVWDVNNPTAYFANSIVVFDTASSEKEILTSAGFNITISSPNISIANTSGDTRNYKFTATRIN